MRTVLVGLILAIFGPAAVAQPGYLNSRGELVKLTPAPERLARHPQVEPGGAVFVVPGTEQTFALNRGVIVRLSQPGKLQQLLNDKIDSS